MPEPETKAIEKPTHKPKIVVAVPPTRALQGMKLAELNEFVVKLGGKAVDGKQAALEFIALKVGKN